MDVARRYADLLDKKGTIGEAQRLRELLALDWERTLDDAPEWATWTGVPGYNHRWTDRSPAAYERRRADARTVAGAAHGIDESALDEADRLTLALFRRQADEKVEGFRFPDEVLVVTASGGVQTTVAMWLGMMPLRQRSDLDDLLARIEAIPVLVEQVTALARDGLARGITTPRAVLGNAVGQLDAFVAGDSPILTPFDNAMQLPAALVADARAKAEQIVRAKVAPAFADYQRFLAEEYVPGARTTIGRGELIDGEEWYAFLARRYTTTSLSPKEIHEIGLSEVARIRAEMERVAAEAGHTGDIQMFFEFLRADERFFFTSAAELLVAYRDIAKRADAQLPRLFGVLPRTPYGVEPVPAHEEKHTTTAYYMRGSMETGRAAAFYANTYDLAARPSWEMEALTLHEAVPGHHLQVALAQEMTELPEFRKHSLVTAYVEGWGLYAESLGPEMGFYADPFSRFGQLTYEMWRAIRLVVDTGLHAFGWTRQQAIDLFAANAGKTLHDITVEVDRYISSPGQALAYKMGELKFKELRARATDALGEQFDVRAFHDEMLRHGAVPLDTLDALFETWLATLR